jgi:hypothetical protein
MKSGWEAAVDFMKDAWSVLSDATGITWDDIVATVTNAIETIKTIFGNIKLSAEIAWTGVKLGFTETGDAIRDVFNGIVAAAKGAWDAVVAGVQQMWENIKDFFASGNAGSIGEAMAKAFNKGFEAEMSAHKFGDSQTTTNLKKELADLTAQFNKLKEEGNKPKPPKEADWQGAVGDTTSDKTKPELKPGATKGLEQHTLKFEFTDLEGFSRKIQEGITATPNATDAATRETATNTGRAVDKLDGIKASIDALKDSGLSGGGTFG